MRSPKSLLFTTAALAALAFLMMASPIQGLESFDTTEVDLEKMDAILDYLTSSNQQFIDAEYDDDMDLGCGIDSYTGYPRCCPGKYEVSPDPQHAGWGWQDNASCKIDSGSGRPKKGGKGGNSGGGGGASQNVGCPSQLHCPGGMSCGCYEKAGLGANKRKFLNAGANVDFLASAMMETETMSSNYAYGDNKRGDAFNGGVCKQNWGMIRKCYAPFRKYGAAAYNKAAALNKDRALDVKVYKACRKHFGGRWMSGHRNGATGLQHPHTKDIKKFQQAYEWTKIMLKKNKAYLKNDVRFWVSVPAI